jgi:ATP/maltotriose-dependent transcriptional regulator MalT
MDSPTSFGTPEADRPVLRVPDREAPLTDFPTPWPARERQALELLARRCSNREIASRLCISWNAVAKRTSSIYRKLGVTNRRTAVKRARALGILPGRFRTEVGA